MISSPEEVRANLAAESEGALADSAGPPDIVSDIMKSISASYFKLRRGLALLAIAFPVALWIGSGAELQASISAYYHFTADGPGGYGAGSMRNLFVGVLCAVGAFLFLYKGYSKKEDWALNLAGLAAVGIALFPMDWRVAPGAEPSTTAMIHNISAVTFFLATAYVCLFRPGDTLPLVKDPAVRLRFKRIYALLGTLMVVIPLGLVALHFLFPRPADTSRVVFFVEAAAIVVFSAFWLFKSREIARIQGQPAEG